jgi:bifunctional non-homologous end joining protein LigD
MGRLDQYLGMRDFKRTPEPRDTGRPSGLALRYSMQKHEATRTHFDLRLEWEGALLSWAVTRGPSFDTGQKRLAVRTEDHPLSYLDFEGSIPEGSYGAGSVMLWDIGHWQPIEPAERGLKKGHLHFNLHGLRLTGGWHLVRMDRDRRGDKGRENWLMMKEDDEAAGREDPVRRYRRSVVTNRTFREIATETAPVPEERAGELPPFRKPQLATLRNELVDGDAWWHELKFDGYRALIALGRGGPHLFTRTGLDWSDRFESLLPAFRPIECESALIDGEIVVGAGLHGFSALQQAISEGGPFQFYAFDLLERNGEDLADTPLEARRAALEDLLRQVPPLGNAQLSPVIDRNAAQVLERICSSGGEGLIAKRRDAPYCNGRTTSWLKVKCEARDEFVILGWQRSDKRGRPFASLALGTHRDGGLVYAGKVGTGFDTEGMEALAAEMQPLARKTAPAKVPTAEARGVQWIEPELVAEVSYAEMTADKRVRHAVYRGLREDKPARTVQLGGDAMQDEGRVNVAGIAVSHPDRVVFPDAGITKCQVAAYYEGIADRMLQTAADRPLSLVRLPEGIGGERFFQKHAGRGFPDAIRTLEIEESDGKRADYMFVSDAAGLVGAAQMGTIEFHIWGARRDRLDRPDRMVFDLDPDEGMAYSDIAGAARDVRDRLEALALPSWPLVTGGKGVHVVVPLRRSAGWETVKLYARIFATLMAQTEPKRFTAEMSKAKRKDRIFIDWLRNERGSTAIAPFSLRAHPGAPVAVPVAWGELDRLGSARAFAMQAALRQDWPEAGVPDPVSITPKRIEMLEKASSRG